MQEMRRFSTLSAKHCGKTNCPSRTGFVPIAVWGSTKLQLLVAGLCWSTAAGELLSRLVLKYLVSDEMLGNLMITLSFVEWTTCSCLQDFEISVYVAVL